MFLSLESIRYSSTYWSIFPLLLPKLQLQLSLPPSLPHAQFHAQFSFLTPPTHTNQPTLQSILLLLQHIPQINMDPQALLHHRLVDAPQPHEPNRVA